MQSSYNKANWIQYVTGILVIAALIFGYVNYTSIKNLNVDTDYPTAEEIAKLIDIPETEVNFPDQKISELYDKVYADEIKDLEKEAIKAVEKEIDEDDIEDFLNENGYSIDEIKDIEINDDETEVQIVNLGLDDEDDREAIVSLEIEVKYTEKTGYIQTKKLVMNADGKFYIDDEEEVDITYSL